MRQTTGWRISMVASPSTDSRLSPSTTRTSSSGCVNGIVCARVHGMVACSLACPLLSPLTPRSYACTCAVCIALQGCRLRNTAEVRGIAVYTGNDTKLMRNSGQCPAMRKLSERVGLRVSVRESVSVCQNMHTTLISPAPQHQPHSPFLSSPIAALDSYDCSFGKRARASEAHAD